MQVAQKVSARVNAAHQVPAKVKAAYHVLARVKVAQQVPRKVKDAHQVLSRVKAAYQVPARVKAAHQVPTRVKMRAGFGSWVRFPSRVWSAGASLWVSGLESGQARVSSPRSVVNRATPWMSLLLESFTLATDISVIPERDFVGLGGEIRDTEGRGLVGIVIRCVR
uniref:Uncharacterized protein n=1 Tax=Cannabis sativa TaxID=3483 RepID=A0A803NPU9_CANSA